MLGRAPEEAGVTCGRYDDRITEWLAGFEDAICAGIAGWVTRAAESAASAEPGNGGQAAGQLAEVMDLVFAGLLGPRSLLPGQLLDLLAVVDVGEREPHAPGGRPRLCAPTPHELFIEAY